MSVRFGQAILRLLRDYLGNVTRYSQQVFFRQARSENAGHAMLSSIANVLAAQKFRFDRLHVEWLESSNGVGFSDLAAYVEIVDRRRRWLFDQRINLMRVWILDAGETIAGLNGGKLFHGQWGLERGIHVL